MNAQALRTLMDLAEKRCEQAGMKLGKLSAHEREMQERLDMLIEYRHQYHLRFLESVRTGTTNLGWSNFQEFMNKLEKAIAQQREALEACRTRKETGKAEWFEERRRMKAFETLDKRNVDATRRQDDRREQCLQDERALRGGGYGTDQGNPH